ncbi:MAG TPA: GNAT family N-acetyltransferase [Candidatus Paceibacterota bacterium]|nr:GNAT family N-acetyltransferase [Candidatus Paceibacterota bacterium]
MKDKGQKLKHFGELDKPSLKYKESFIEATKEFEAAGENIYLHGRKPDEDFDQLLRKIKEREEGINLPADRVPQTELWFVEDGKIIGWTKIRHRLNENLLLQGGHIGYSIRPSERNKGYGTRILELALSEAKRPGLNKVLLTCDDDNTGSAKVIEKNGGILENKIENEGKLKRRYWIKLKQ